MKKIIALSAAALLCGTSLIGKTADELRIYINPGHGSWTSNDRPMKTLRDVDGEMVTVDPNTKSGAAANDGWTPDTTAFYETNTNLRKCFALLDRLESYGLRIDRTKNQEGNDPQNLGAAKDLSNNLVMSHVKAGPYPYDNAASEYYNRSLSEICVEVESNNFDMFISVHSNAATDGNTVNYLASFYRGKNGVGGDRAPGSRDMAKAIWPYAFGVKYQLWTARKSADESLCGDVDFYGSESESSAIPGVWGYLGALKHNVPGFLVEGYFHTYQPSRHRAMNFDADRIEGYQYARGIADYFGLEKEKTGEIYGLVRDLHEKFSHTIYIPQGGTNDAYKPLNGVTVKLLKDGAEVKSVVTDNNYNGAFVFDGIEPGTYTLEFSHPDYKPADENQPTTVEVKAAETTYPEIFLEAVNYEPPAVTYYNYPDELVGEPIGPADEYVFNQEYVDEPIAELAGKNIRRTIVRGDKAVILAHDENKAPTIVIQDLSNKAVVRTVGTEGAVGSIMTISDITMTADGYLIGMNADVLPFGGSNVVKIYKWNKGEDGLPEGDPEIIVSMNHAGNWTEAEFGKTMTYSGTLADGYVLFANKSTANNNTRIEHVAISEGASAGYSHMNFNSNGITDDLFGDYEMNMSPIHDDHFIITSEKLLPMEVAVDKASGAVPTIVGTMPEGLIDGTGFRGGFFKYAGKAYMVAPTQFEGENSGVALIDITDGLDNATVVTTTNTTLPAPTTENPEGMAKAWATAAAGAASANAYVTVNRDDLGKYESSSIDLYVNRGDAKMSKITTEGVEQPKFRSNFAYDLAMTKDGDDMYTLTFKSTGEAPAAKVILTNTEDESTAVVEIGEVKPGENSVQVDASALPEGSYNWAIEIESKAIPTAGVFFTAHPEGLSNNTARGGVVVITDPEAPSFGKAIVAHGWKGGIEVYNPDLTFQGLYHKDAATMANNGASLFRGDQRDGKAYFTDWSDAGAGYWIFDPEAPETLTNFLEGSNNGTGAFVIDGEVIGGGATSVAFVGKGDDCRMYSFVEDYPTGNAGNITVRYDIGSAQTLAQKPNATFSELSAARYFPNTNVEIAAAENGMFVSQVRSAGNNITAVPGFVYADYSGNILMNSGNLEDLNCCGSGIALSADGTTFAVSDPAESGVTIFDVTWADNVPSMTKRYTINCPGVGANPEHGQMKFDLAGNLHVYNRGIGYQLLTLVNPEPKATTPARSEYLITGTASGVEDVIAEREVKLSVYPNPATDVVTVKAGEDINELAIYSLMGVQMGVDTNVNGGEATLNVSPLQNGTYIIRVNGQTVKLIKK